MKKCGFFILMLFFITGCAAESGQKKNVKPKSFEFPQVPTVLTEPADRAAYLAEHYWDKFDFSDTSYCSVPEVTEQAFVNFLDVLNHTTPAKVKSSITGMLKKAETDSTMFAYFVKLYDNYLYDPNSPMRNEEHYISVLETMLASDKMPEIKKVRPARRLALALKNRVDSIANDFSYTDKAGKSARMSAIKAPYTLLFFNNPGCETCKKSLEFLKQSSMIKAMVRDKQLVILAVYPDEDIVAWREHTADFPKEWLNGYDKDQMINQEELYDLRAIPSFYLLDKDKRVILKDVPVEQIEVYYNSLIVECS